MKATSESNRRAANTARKRSGIKSTGAAVKEQRNIGSGGGRGGTAGWRGGRSGGGRDPKEAGQVGETGTGK